MKAEEEEEEWKYGEKEYWQEGEAIEFAWLLTEAPSDDEDGAEGEEGNGGDGEGGGERV